MIVLGIETSCDETAVAVIRDDKTILSNLVLSQLEEHKAFGGVVPEIAARAHLDHLDAMIKGAMEDAAIGFDDLDGVAATCGPGLIGGVMVGMMAGKAIAAAKNLPFIAVNHLEAHALTPRLTNDLEFPYLLLLVSGGHTQLLIAEDVGRYKKLGTTIDDALGECFDKAAKLMGLGHPGGPLVERATADCKDHDAALKKFPLPIPMKGREGCDFSFSGLKTAVRNHVEKLPEGKLAYEDVCALCYAFQETVAQIVIDRCGNALEHMRVRYGNSAHKPALVVSGGVAANKRLRKALTDLAAQNGTECVAPPLELCSDNGAMIAWTGIERLKRNMTDPLDTSARPRWPLDDAQ
ncbi:MAG: tRNA (adenosine(37)-N6)-threonylcarbamoyltransferase complex transferase subunit TsaD [Micavibrio aeruginosavorus]|uniref:tRNA N6-adenosine threonylcarbamoyltransferase n=1 Tax=Micavibrio aeruginosavorus TaxID=349221 RepID=A0A2W5PKY1_9BACT|nr:MAG: tRNA (adenosine(37)-N6)-threonylcarbamoyltransferase complex transferase subunit TsaD [Micavibrio aeruginosavorus]